MIKSIRLQNFFGFQDCTINLEKGENVLVGINGSGKSNFFKAIQFITNGVQMRGLNNLVNKTWGGVNNLINKNAKEEDSANLTFEICPDLFQVATPPTKTRFVFNIRIERIQNINYKLYESASIKYENGTENLIYEFSAGEGKISERQLQKNVLRGFKSEFGGKELYLSNFVSEELYPDFNTLTEELGQVHFFSAFEVAQHSDIRRSLPPVGDAELDEDGSNLIQVLNYLKLSNRTTYAKIIDALRKVNENFEDIEFKNFSNQLELHLIEKGLNSSIPPQLISDGTLKFLCLMTAIYGAKSGSVICIDEPELGLHPDMIHTLSEAIKYAAKTSQVIISTHSPQLLDWFDFENVRVFEKDENNATVVRELDKEHYRGWYDTYMLGDMWIKGDIGGKRW